jgi:pimeloyl-ACP methyl ester carboxylesterase
MLKSRLSNEKKIIFLLMILSVIVIYYFAQNKLRKEKKWAPEVKTVFVESSLDRSHQPCLFYVPPYNETPPPLLVALHTWSGDYRQLTSIPYFEYCQEKGWVFIHPNFRGPNDNPEATGSAKAIQDIFDAVTYAKNNSRIDNKRIYLVGCSGGGYAGLLVAARHPNLWTGVSVWAAVVDLKQFYFESLRKKNMDVVNSLSKSCGGEPGQTESIDEEYRRRSPVHFLKKAGGLNIDLNAGIHDGYSGSVPINHSLEAFNLLCQANDLNQYKLTEDEIKYFVKNQSVPEHLRKERAEDLSYGINRILFRRIAGPVRLTIFDGGHEIITRAAGEWFSRQVRR